MNISRMIPVAAALAAISCGGGGGGSSTPTSPSTPAPAGPATISILGSGVTPNVVRIEVGQQVRFTNNGSRNIELHSDPHPTHQACPPLNEMGMIAPGQSRNSGTFTVRGTCSFHDHNDPDNMAFRGQVLVAVVEPGPAPDYKTSQ